MKNSLFKQCFIGVLIAMAIAVCIYFSAESIVNEVQNSGNYTRLGEFTNVSSI